MSNSIQPLAKEANLISAASRPPESLGRRLRGNSGTLLSDYPSIPPSVLAQRLTVAAVAHSNKPDWISLSAGSAACGRLFSYISLSSR